MTKKLMAWKPKGMNRDLSVSSFNPEFAFENVNLRLSTNENNTLMSWVTEKGPASIVPQTNTDPPVGVTIVGITIGTAVINKRLVLFTHSDSEEVEKPDRIYVLEWDSKEFHTMNCRKLYEGNLDFDIDHPLETLVSYEAEHIQKVYWTDNKNQPRMINIKAPDEKIAWWNGDGSEFPYVDTFFDFIPALRMNETFEVEQSTAGGGIFAPGVIQYCFTYINKYGQQSNIVSVSPLYYLIKDNRGASPEEKVSCNFKITITAPNADFDYVRLYSIQRTSLDLDPIVRLVNDIPITDIFDDIVYIDNGTVGSTMDPTELLYVGGVEILAKTMADKDQTLFLGNITQKNYSIDAIQEYFNTIRGTNAVEIEFDNQDSIKYINKESADDNTWERYNKGFYSYYTTLKNNSRKVTTFKGGETYRFGFQLQKNTGEWSQPIFIDDKENPLYPNTGIYTGDITLTLAKATIPITNIIDTSIYKRIRPVIVYPSIEDRTVLCQGVINPTVFNIKDRIDKYPFAQASWYFRPYMWTTESSYRGPSNNLGITVKYSTTRSGANEDSYFDDKVQDKYALLVTCGINESISEYLKKGYFLCQSYISDGEGGGSYNTYREYFDGAIYLGIQNNRKRYILLRDTRFDAEGGESNINYLSVDAIPSIDSFPFYIGMQKNSNNLYYYISPSNDHLNFIFKCSIGGTWYEITFGDPEIYENIRASAGAGNWIPFTHYDSLVAAGGTDTEHQVEIQGLKAVYSTPYMANLEDTTANNQFFVDQSIVTFNSPDIEFDTEVQVYGNKGLKLRIVGAIPITANVSSHYITASTPMLQLDYQKTTEEGVPNTKDNIAFGKGERDYNVVYNNISCEAGNRLVAEYLWNDSLINEFELDDGKNKVDTDPSAYDFMVYPWHRSGSLNNDTRGEAEASSFLKQKKEANLLYSYETEYFQSHNIDNYNFESISSKIALTENAEVFNYSLPKQYQNMSEINYYPNIDKVLYNTDGYNTIYSGVPSGEDNENTGAVDEKYLKSVAPVYMKYKSTSHAVIALNGYFKTLPQSSTPNLGFEFKDVPIMPYGYLDENTNIGKCNYAISDPAQESYSTFWGDIAKFQQDGINISNLFLDDLGNHVKHNYLWLGELYKEPALRFGGKSANAVRSNKWLPCGDTVDLSEHSDTVTLYWTEGDTYYQRYDCLKTYAFTKEDQNQIVEILSFMCETHVNIDGRYDNRRGQLENYNMSPEIFNQINPVYSQKNNFFNYKQLDTSDWTDTGYNYSNQIYYSKTKTSGADVDLWTNVTLASTLELDGDKGELNSLQRFNDQVIAFQDTGISQILYNENVQISSTQGVPIEIANSGKVQGKRYFSDTIGCSNKWSIANTPIGIYFMDSIGKSIYLFNGQLTPLSFQGGFNTWTKQNIPSASIQWNPTFNEGHNNFVTYYDKMNQDVLFINNETCLAYSERVGAFTSFYNYEGTPYFCNLDDTGIWVRRNDAAKTSVLYHHNEGDYCNFFGTNMPYSMTLVGNAEPSTDKIFTNLEFRANSDGEGTSIGSKFIPYVPFDSLESWNEHQHGIANLAYGTGRYATLHHVRSNDASLNRKFRIWRCDIPRDNAPVDTESENSRGIYRFNTHPLDRMRNPWVYLKLTKGAANPEETLPRTEIHDILMTYFN